jgi:hypothetical protein
MERGFGLMKKHISIIQERMICRLIYLVWFISVKIYGKRD